MKMDKEKETVTIIGMLEVKSMTDNLKRKLKKTVQVFPEKNKNNEDGITKIGFPVLRGLNQTLKRIRTMKLESLKSGVRVYLG